jgi:hypothetical protein
LTIQTSESEPPNVATFDRRGDELLHAGGFRATEALVQGSSIQQWLDSGLCHQQCFRATLGKAASVRFISVAGGQYEAQEENGNESDRRERDEEPRR